MILSSSNLYKKEWQNYNNEYINAVNNEQYDKVFNSYTDKEGSEYYVLSPVRAKHTFTDFVDVVLDIPIDKLYVSDFYPFYLLEAGNHPDNFRKCPSDIKDNMKSQPNFYILKQDFHKSFIQQFDSNNQIH